MTYCAVIEEILRSYGFITYVANNAGEALLLLEDTLPDLIMLDIMMPEVDGITFVRRIRSNPLWDSIPIIIASARPLDKGRDSVEDIGANAFLSKPFSARELRAVLREFLAIPESGILRT